MGHLSEPTKLVVGFDLLWLEVFALQVVHLVAIKVIRDPYAEKRAKSHHNDRQQNKGCRDQVVISADLLVKEHANTHRNALE